jgi:hypothetical protein
MFLREPTWPVINVEDGGQVGFELSDLQYPNWTGPEASFI